MSEKDNEWLAYRPYIVGAAIGLLLLNSWYLLSIAVENALVPKWYDQALSIINGAIGAFVGAYAAFLLQSTRESKSETERRKAALNQAFFILGRQSNALELVKRDYEKYNHEISLAFNMPAYKQPDYSQLRIDLDSLMFLLDIESPQILLDLAIEQERFEQAMSAIEIRNTFYVGEIQPAMSKLGLNNKSLSEKDLRDSLGERLFKGCINGTNEIKRHVGESLVSQEEVTKKLKLLAKKLFPGKKFIGFEIIKPETPKAS